MRAAQKYQEQYKSADTTARPIRPSTAKPSATNTINNSPKRGARPRTAHPSRGDNLTIKSIYSVHKVDRYTRTVNPVKSLPTLIPSF